MQAQEKMGGGYIFVLLLNLLAIVPLLYLSLLGFTTQNLSMVVVSVIFFSFIILTLAFDFLKHIVPSGATYGHAAFSMTIGFIIAMFLNFNTSLKSVFSVPTSYLLSSIEGQLPLFWNFYANIFGAAVAEENLFLITLPLLTLGILSFAAKSVKILGNEYLQLVIASSISAVLFAYFHIGNSVIMAFIISAIIFRTFLIWATHGDRMMNLIPFLTVLLTFAYGFHISNNLSFYGIFTVFQTFLTEPFGIVILIFLISSFIFGFFYFLKLVGIRK